MSRHHKTNGDTEPRLIAGVDVQADRTYAVVISPTGVMTFVWDDALQPLCDLGEPSIVRASHVEPTAEGQWSADMSPSGGPVLTPCQLRSEALAAEREWLRTNRGL